MKVNFRLGPKGPVDREKAKVCLIMNLGVPGSGSLMAGRLVGYPQLVLTFCGLAVSMIFGGKMLTWTLGNWSRLQNSNDPMASLTEIWQAIKWPLAGLGIFALAWLWGLITGLMVLATAKSDETSSLQAPNFRQ